MSESYVYPTGRTAAQVYEELHATTDYAVTEHGLNTEHLYADCKTMLDVGCGRSPFGLRLARDYRLSVTVCDLSTAATAWQLEQLRFLGDLLGYGSFVISDEPPVDLAASLPFATSTFDAVTCFDVLEHLPPERVGFAIRELCRVAKKRVVITVGTQPSKRKGPGGEELHLTVRDERWWYDQINLVLGNCYYGATLEFGDGRPQCPRLRTERIEARIRRGQPAVSTVFIVELTP